MRGVGASCVEGASGVTGYDGIDFSANRGFVFFNAGHIEGNENIGEGLIDRYSLAGRVVGNAINAGAFCKFFLEQSCGAIHKWMVALATDDNRVRGETIVRRI